jgi:hypothetical protein
LRRLWLWTATGPALVMRVAFALLLLAGCQAPPPPPLPTLTELRAHQTQPDHIPVQPAAPLPASPVLSVQRIDLPLQTDTRKAWDLVNPRVSSATRIDAWRNNGLAIGVMPAKAFPAFAEAVGDPAGLRRAILSTSPRWTPLIQAPRQTQSITADLTVLPRPPREMELADGRIQLLLRAESGPLGVAVISLCPHHQLERLTLEPRTPYEIMLDGELLDPLQLTVNLQRGEALVLGLPPLNLPPSPDNDRTLPAPPTAPGTPGTPAPGAPGVPSPSHKHRRAARPDRAVTFASPDSNAPAGPSPDGKHDATSGGSGGSEELDIPDNAVTRDTPDVPPTLGRAFFTSRRTSGPIQSIYLITLAEQ